MEKYNKIDEDKELDELFSTILAGNVVKELYSILEPKNYTLKDDDGNNENSWDNQDEMEILEKLLDKASQSKKKKELLGEVRAIIADVSEFKSPDLDIINTSQKIELVDRDIVLRSWHVSCPAIITCYYEPISTLPLERWEQEKLLKYVKL